MPDMESKSREIERQVYGFKASFGGEELRRASAALSAAVSTSPSPVPLGSPDSPESPHRSNGGADVGHALDATTDVALRELLCEAQFYTEQAQGQASPDFDTLYSHGLVLQELARNSDEHALPFLREACDKYSAALRVRPDSHVTLYNLGVALSEQSRVLRTAGDTSQARECLRLASHMYARALEASPSSSQTLNNWGLILHELSSDAPSRHERDDLVRGALGKFRCALRSHPDFDRSCYNLGTVCHAYASTLQQELNGGAKVLGASLDQESLRQGQEAKVRQLFTMAAQYICMASALQQQKDVYRKSLSIVKQLLPLPFLRAGPLLAPLVASLGSVDETWEQQMFVLDHVSLRAASDMEASLSFASSGHVVTPRSAAAAAGGTGGEQPLLISLTDVTAVRRCCDPSLPAGEAFWVALESDPQGMYLVAEDAEGADAWVDALLICHHIVRTRGIEALAEALSPGHAQQPTQARAARH